MHFALLGKFPEREIPWLTFLAISIDASASFLGAQIKPCKVGVTRKSTGIKIDAVAGLISAAALFKEPAAKKSAAKCNQLPWLYVLAE